ncbi:MAG: hypothetical protein LBP68_08460 [Acidobacteriota bacterium]|jgi:hypothetical protein|nr:hypothetical protein [Acidobacteriota bacterium]
MIRTTVAKSLVAFGTLALLSGCGSPDVAMMKQGLERTGMPAAQADCLAEKMSGDVDSEPYNYMASLMSEGMEEKDAINRARRKFGAEFTSAVRDARRACAELTEPE